MKRIALLAIVAAAALPVAARGAACSPLDCAASQFTLANGKLLGFRTGATRPVTVVDLATGEARWVLPSGLTARNLLVHQAGPRTLAWYDASRGTRLYNVAIPTAGFHLQGVSQDGTRAVVHRVVNGHTEFLILSHSSSPRALSVDGKQWAFDALRGDNLFLIEYLHSGGYKVRLMHVASGKLEPQALKDPHESGIIWGQPFSRLSSADGRYLFTLYIGSNGGAMIHELDLKLATARCIDLPGTGDYGSAATWAMMLTRDQSKLWAVNPGYGHVVAIDIGTRAVTSTFRIQLAYWNRGNGTAAALAPDGAHIAIADGKSVAILGLRDRKVVDRHAGHALALGYSPAGRLWTLA